MTEVTQKLLEAIRATVKNEPNPAIAHAKILLALKDKS